MEEEKDYRMVPLLKTIQRNINMFKEADVFTNIKILQVIYKYMQVWWLHIISITQAFIIMFI
jgi:hypothetical protein